jgi:hypothetical protein
MYLKFEVFKNKSQKSSCLAISLAALHTTEF